MKPDDDAGLENLRQRTAAMLTAMDDTAIPQMDATFYQHYVEELRLLLEEWQSATIGPCPVAPQRIWQASRRGLPLGMFTGEGVTALVCELTDVTFTPHTVHYVVPDDLLDEWRRT